MSIRNGGIHPQNYTVSEPEDRNLKGQMDGTRSLKMDIKILRMYIHIGVTLTTETTVPPCIIGMLNVTLGKSTEGQGTVHGHSHKVGSTIKHQLRNISFKWQMSTGMLACFLTIYPLENNFHT
jgi:hypothetical protein